MPRTERYEGLWQIMRPACRHITYFRFEKPNMHHTKMPVLRCRCGKYFTFTEAEVFIGGVCERAEETPKANRDAEVVELINPHAVKH